MNISIPYYFQTYTSDDLYLLEGETCSRWYADHALQILHRESGPAYINHKNGDWAWYKKGTLHRSNGPAVQEDNTFLWFNAGHLHREDGWAVEYPDGTGEFYFYSKKVETNSLSEFRRIIKKKEFL